MHQVVNAGEQQPLAAAQPPDQGVHEGAGIRLMTGDGPRGPLDDALYQGSICRTANSTFAGRSASRRMYQRYHAAP